MNTKIARLNPLWAPPVRCSACGEEMKMNLDKTASGQISKLVYVCVNEKTGCSYQVSSDARLNGQATVYHPPVEKKD